MIILAEIQIEELSDLLHMSKFRFLKIFKQTTGDTSYQYILRKKMELAEQPIIQVAYDLGFSNQSHFNKSFKRFFGYSPGKLRQ